MNSLLESWEGAIEIDGTSYEKISDVPSDLIFIDGMNILFKSKSKSSSGQAAKASCNAMYINRVNNQILLGS